MASQEYIGYLHEAQAELALQRNNLVKIDARKAWELFPSVHADIVAKVAIIENMLVYFEPPRTRCERKRRQGGKSLWQRLTRLDSADEITGPADLVNIAVTAVGTILNEVESTINRHVPPTSSFLKKNQGTSVKWCGLHSILFDNLQAPVDLKFSYAVMSQPLPIV